MQFSKIVVSRIVHLTVEERNDGNIVITADQNVMPYVELSVKNGVFKATVSDDVNIIGNAQNYVDISIPYNGAINTIAASGACKVNVVPLLKQEKLTLSVSGASLLTLHVQADACTADVYGASKLDIDGKCRKLKSDVSGASKATFDMECTDAALELSGASSVDAELKAVKTVVDVSGCSSAVLAGSAESLEAETSGSSSVNARKFIAQVCTVSASGASQASVNCTRSLSASASGASAITYAANEGMSLASARSSGMSTIKKR